MFILFQSFTRLIEGIALGRWTAGKQGTEVMLPGCGCRLTAQVSPAVATALGIACYLSIMSALKNSPKLYWVEIYFLNREQGLPARAVLLFLALHFKSPEYQAGRPFTMFIDLCFCA